MQMKKIRLLSCDYSSIYSVIHIMLYTSRKVEDLKNTRVCLKLTHRDTVWCVRKNIKPLVSGKPQPTGLFSNNLKRGVKCSTTSNYYDDYMNYIEMSGNKIFYFPKLPKPIPLNYYAPHIYPSIHSLCFQTSYLHLMLEFTE